MKLPRDCSGLDLAKALRSLGYEITRQDGSHMRLTRNHPEEHHVTIPNHKPLRIGLLSSLLKDIARHNDRSVEQLLHDLDL